jgi:DNA-binding transcriptional LysR family regulator
MPTLRQLESFVARVDEGSFTRAADRLFVSQPGLSQQIAALEKELGGSLFSRLPRAVSLTPTGRALLPHARAAGTAAERGSAAARAATGS